jgi:hypothetical protein
LRLDRGQSGGLLFEIRQRSVWEDYFLRLGGGQPERTSLLKRVRSRRAHFTLRKVINLETSF